MKIYIVSNHKNILSATTSKTQAYAYCEELNAYRERHNSQGYVEKYEVIETENMEVALPYDEIPFCVMTVNEKIYSIPYASADICDTICEFSSPTIYYAFDSFDSVDQRNVKRSNMIVYLSAKDANSAIEKAEKVTNQYVGSDNP